MTDYISRQREKIAQDIDFEYARLRGQLARWQAEHGWLMRGHWRGMARYTIRTIRAKRYGLSTWEALA